MTDVAPELLAAIQAEYEEGIAGSRTLTGVRSRIEHGSAGYEDADKYADEVGRILTEACDDVLTEDALPGGILYYNIAVRVLEPVIMKAYQEVAQATAQVQDLLNQRAGIGIRAIIPQLEQKRIDALIEEILANEEKE